MNQWRIMHIISKDESISDWKNLDGLCMGKR